MHNTSQTGKPAPNMIKLAIMAAGGFEAVAQEFGITHWAVREWDKHRRVPPERIRRLCDLGGVINANQILAQIEATAAEKAVA